MCTGLCRLFVSLSCVKENAPVMLANVPKKKKRLLLKEARTKDGCNEKRRRVGQNMSLKCCTLDHETQHVTKESLKTKSPGLHTNRLKAAACSGKDSVVEDT